MFVEQKVLENIYNTIIYIKAQSGVFALDFQMLPVTLYTDNSVILAFKKLRRKKSIYGLITLLKLQGQSAVFSLD